MQNIIIFQAYSFTNSFVERLEIYIHCLSKYKRKIRSYIDGLQPPTLFAFNQIALSMLPVIPLRVCLRLHVFLRSHVCTRAACRLPHGAF